MDFSAQFSSQLLRPQRTFSCLSIISFTSVSLIPFALNLVKSRKTSMKSLNLTLSSSSMEELELYMSSSPWWQPYAALVFLVLICLLILLCICKAESQSCDQFRPQAGNEFLVCSTCQFKWERSSNRISRQQQLPARVFDKMKSKIFLDF